jgi:hypothetical protein
MAKDAPIRIETLDPNQLNGLRERFESDLEQLMQSSMSLQRITAAFGSSGKAIETLAASKEGASRTTDVVANIS